MQYARILYHHSYPPFVLICPLFPHTKNNPTPYFAHFLKEILRMRAHSREGNIKGNSPGGGWVISIAPKAENRQISYHNKEWAVLDLATVVLTSSRPHAR